MIEPVVQVSPLWVFAAAALLGILALSGAAFNGVLARREQTGGPLPATDRTGRRAGALTPLAETARLLRQRRRSSIAADALLWRIGIGGLVVVALLMVTVIPLGRWTVADLNVGVVWFNAMDVMVWAFVWMAGWGANSAHSLIGGYRFLAQALSYELPLMFALITPAVAAGSLRVGDVVAAQSDLWFIVSMPVAFLIFCASVVAFSVWGPLSSAAGSDIAGGIMTEVSGVDRLLLLAGRYALLAAGAAFAVPLFLGGGAGPVLPDWSWTLVKTLLVLGVLIAVRRRLPLIRPDRLAVPAWMIVLPVVLLQILVVSLLSVRS